jgi:hypothetical protein
VKTKESADIEERYSLIVDALLHVPGVTHGSPTKKGFGKEALQIDGKIFAMLVRNRLVLKLPRQRVDELIALQQGDRFDPGNGRLMKEWVELESASNADWLVLTRESLAFVSSSR